MRRPCSIPIQRSTQKKMKKNIISQTKQIFSQISKEKVKESYLILALNYFITRLSS